MTTGLDEFQRRMLAIEEYGAERRQEKILKMLLEERESVLKIWPGSEYLQGIERAIYIVGGEKAVSWEATYTLSLPEPPLDQEN